MKLSVIITNHKTPELLDLCLESVKKAAVGLDYEVFISDSEVGLEKDGWTGKGTDKIKYFPFEKNVGYAKLVNKGLAEAKGEFVLILNADIILEEDSLKKMISFFENEPRAGILGPKLLNFNGSTQASRFRFYKPSTILFRRTFWKKTSWGKKELARFLMEDQDIEKIHEADWLLGAALMVRRRALEEVGLMDERFFLYFEDVDWCRRFKEKNWQVVYFPEAVMHHYHGRKSKKSGGSADLFFNRYVWIHIFSAFKYFLKYR